MTPYDKTKQQWIKTRTPAFWDTPTRLMITYTSDSHQIPSQNKTTSKLRILKIAKNSNFEILHETLHATHLLQLLDKMYKYEMDPIRTVGATERTRNAGRTDGRTDGNQYTPLPPQQLRCAGVWLYIMSACMPQNEFLKYITIEHLSKSSNVISQALDSSCVWASAVNISHESIDPSHKSHNALDKYPKMHHFVTEMCTRVQISVTKWCIVGYLSNTLWDLWNRSIWEILATTGSGNGCWLFGAKPLPKPVLAYW